MEIRRRCRRAGLDPPARNTIGRRWEELKEAQAELLADEPDALMAPGNEVPIEFRLPSGRSHAARDC